jgi:ABC-type amino acid transport substrate-binding protein
VVCGHHDHCWLWRQGADYLRGARRGVYLDAVGDYHRICPYGDDHITPYGGAHLDVPVKGPQDLPRVRVGAITDTTGESYLQYHRITYTSYKTALEGLRAIEAGEIEALIFDAPILRYLIHHELKGDLEVLPHTFHREDYGIALPKGSSLREPINRVLLQKIHGREWQDIVHQYLGGSFDLNTARIPQ